MKNLFFELSSKELGKISGIYLLQIGTHKYVGSSKSLYARLAEHRTDLTHETHSNKAMLRCYKKYNEVLYEILEFCAPEIRIEREAFWIKELNTDLNQQDPVLKTLSESSKQKISKSLKEGYATGRIKKISVFQPVEMYDIEGNFLQEFPSAIKAAEQLGVSSHTVQIAASKYYAGRTCGFFRFRYKYSKVPPQKFKYTNTNKLVSKFDFVIIEPNGTIIPIKMGIKYVNDAILQQLFKGNLEFTIKGIPKVPVKPHELLEQPEAVNQQPSSGSALSTEKVQRLIGE